MTTWHTAAELAGLPGLPGTVFGTRAWLTRIGVPSRPRSGRGGGQEFDAAQLPEATRRALLARQIAASSLPVTLIPGEVEQVAKPPESFLPAPVATTPKPPSHAAAACADARMILVRQVEASALLIGTTRAIAALAEQLAKGSADATLLHAAEAANRRRREAGSISVTTLYSWLSAFKAEGWWGLCPRAAKSRPLSTVPADVAAVIKHYSSAKGAARNLTEVAQAVIRAQDRPFDEWRSLYHQARRALKKIDKTTLIKARHTGADRAARLPFKRRGTENLAPLDLGLVDGHSFKAKVRHPDHGQPFTPEVTVVKDAATRRITGWSTSLSESTWAVGAAVCHSAQSGGIHAIMYSDNGQGERAKQLDCPVDGLYARLGTDHRTGRPNHPQARGLLERSWRTHMIRAARQFPTFQGKDVDKGTLRKVQLELQREQRAVDRARTTGELVTLSPRIPTWQEFIAAIERAITEYNRDHRHRALPKHTSGPHAGLHMTPDEAWAVMLVAEDQDRPSPEEARMLFLPSKLCTAQRGEVRFINQHYAAPELMDVDGEKVSVRYDIHDPSRVWIWTAGGEFVCEAKLDANRSDFFPKPVIEQARERRVRGMVKRAQQRIDTAERELLPTMQAAAGMQPTTAGAELPMVEIVEPDAPVASEGPARPLFDSQAERYEWLQLHRQAWTAADGAWLRTYVESDGYASLADYYAGRGMAWEGDAESFKSAG